MAETPEKKRGRPLTYTSKTAAIICARLATGETLRAICRDENMPPESTVRGWVVDDVQGFAAQYARSRDIGLDSQADELVEIARNGANDWIETEDGAAPNHEHINRSRLIVDTMKWRLSKMAPKRYGDRLELAGDKDAPLQTRVVIEVVDSPKE